MMPRWLRRFVGLDLPAKAIARYDSDRAVLCESAARVERSHERLKTAIEIDGYTGALSQLQRDLWLTPRRRGPEDE